MDKKKTTERLAIYFDVSRLYPSEILDLIERCQAIENVSQWTTDGQKYLGATIDTTTYAENGWAVSIVTEDVTTSKRITTSDRAKRNRKAARRG